MNKILLFVNVLFFSLSFASWAGCSAGKEEPEVCIPLQTSFDQDTVIPKGCYLAQKTPTIGAQVKLTLAPGVKIIFSQDTQLEFGAKQTLYAVGTKELPILLTAEQPQRGFWKGLNFDATESADNRMEYVTVEYGGSTKSDANAAGIRATSGAVTLSLSNTNIRESQGWGLYLGGSANIPVFANNTLTKNTLGPANVDSEVAGLLDAGSIYTGNDVDRVMVRAQYVSKNANWAAIGVPYFIDGNLNVSVPWTIAAGNTLIVAEDGWISIADEAAALIAVGTAEKPILFTGEQKTRGFWKGLILGTGIDPGHQIDFVTVEYAGDTTSDRDNAGIKAIADSRGVTLSISNTTIRECQGWGLYLTGSAVLPVFANNTFTKNTLGPVSVDSEVAGILDTASTYTDNDVDRIMVRAQWVSKNANWAAIGVPYFIDGNLSVSVPWTIAAGNTLIVAEDGWISIADEAAALIAVGTAEKPILFTGEQKTRGFWKGLILGTGIDPGHQIDFVTVEYAGDTTSDRDNAGIKAIADSRGVTLSISNTTIRECQGWGLYLTGSAKIPVFANNTLTNNTLGPVMAGSTAVHQLDTSSTYTGNDVDQVMVLADWVNKTVTWQDLGVPYRLDGGLDVNGNETNPVVWTLAPGVTLMLPQAAILSVPGDYSGFSARGTLQKPITITGVEKTNGFWKSIAFGSTNNSANSIDHAIIEYGGSVGGTGEQGMIQASSDSHGVTVSVTNSVIQHSGLWGIWFGGSASGDIETGNTFLDNASGDIFRE